MGDPFILVGMVAALLLALGILAAIGQVPLSYNIRNLIVRWQVTSLTVFAFTVVVTLLVVMLAFVNGMQALTQTSGQPGNVMVMADGATDEAFSNLAYGESTNIEREYVAFDEEGIPFDPPIRVRSEKVGDQERYWASQETYVIVNQPVPIRPGERPRSRFVQVRGIVDPEVSGKVHAVELEPGGQWFSDAGVRPLPGRDETAIEAVLGSGVATTLAADLGKRRLEVGDTFGLGDRTWIVVGINDTEGSTFSSEIWAKHANVATLFRKDNYSTIVMRVDDDSEEGARELARHLASNFKPAVVARTQREYFANLSSTNQQFLVAILFVAAVMAIGGLFGVMNTMFAAISQRTRDIAVLRILGYRPWQILVCFMLESMLIALVGGLLGMLVGSLADGWSANSVVSSGQGGGKSIVLRMTVDAQILAFALLYAATMGFLGGLFPSISAMRLRPLESLR